jgi:hypothetical protein
LTVQKPKSYASNNFLTTGSSIATIRFLIGGIKRIRYDMRNPIKQLNIASFIKYIVILFQFGLPLWIAAIAISRIGQQAIRNSYSGSYLGQMVNASLKKPVDVFSVNCDGKVNYPGIAMRSCNGEQEVLNRRTTDKVNIKDVRFLSDNALFVNSARNADAALLGPKGKYSFIESGQMYIYQRINDRLTKCIFDSTENSKAELCIREFLDSFGKLSSVGEKDLADIFGDKKTIYVAIDDFDKATKELHSIVKYLALVWLRTKQDLKEPTVAEVNARLSLNHKRLHLSNLIRREGRKIGETARGLSVYYVNKRSLEDSLWEKG